jgi:hypothetical protein
MTAQLIPMIGVHIYRLGVGPPPYTRTNKPMYTIHVPLTQNYTLNRSRNTSHDICWDCVETPRTPRRISAWWRCRRIGKSLGHGGHNLRLQRQRTRGRSGDQSQHAWCVDVRWGWWRGRWRWRCCIRTEWPMTGGCVAPQVADEANTLCHVVVLRLNALQEMTFWRFED